MGADCGGFGLLFFARVKRRAERSREEHGIENRQKVEPTRSIMVRQKVSFEAINRLFIYALAESKILQGLSSSRT